LNGIPFINYLVSIQSAYRNAVEQVTIPASYYQIYAYNQQKQRKKDFFTSATYTTRAMLETLKSWFEESPDKPARY